MNWLIPSHKPATVKPRPVSFWVQGEDDGTDSHKHCRQCQRPKPLDEFPLRSGPGGDGQRSCRCYVCTQANKKRRIK